MSADREKTNIEVYRDTWRKLNMLKEEPGDSFDDVITRLIECYEREGDE